MVVVLVGGGWVTVTVTVCGGVMTVCGGVVTVLVTVLAGWETVRVSVRTTVMFPDVGCAVDGLAFPSAGAGRRIGDMCPPPTVTPKNMPTAVQANAPAQISATAACRDIPRTPHASTPPQPILRFRARRPQPVPQRSQPQSFVVWLAQRGFRKSGRREHLLEATQIVAVPVPVGVAVRFAQAALVPLALLDSRPQLRTQIMLGTNAAHWALVESSSVSQ